MKIAYLLESTGLCGGVKVVFRQVEALRARGHEAVILSREPFPDWFEGKVGFVRGEPIDEAILSTFDIIITTTPIQTAALYAITVLRSRLHQLVQGFEGDCSECLPYLDSIHTAYRLPVPKLTVSQRLADRLNRMFPGNRFVSVGQGVESQYFFPDAVESNHEKFHSIIMVGPLTISVKQMEMGLQAFALAKQCKSELRLVRISTIDTREAEERIAGPIEQYHVHLSPREVGEAFRREGGVFFSSSGMGEGFGLPAVEAMACGIPAILTNIDSYLAFSTPRDYAVFTAHDNPAEMADAICRLTSDPDLCRRLRQRGLETSARFSFARVALRIEKILGHE